MLEIKLSEKQEDQIIAASENEALEFSTQDLEQINKNDAIDWVKTDELHALVSESAGGIIGYIHKEYIDAIATILNLHDLTTKP